MKLNSTQRVYALGVVLLVSLTICSRKFAGDGEAFPIIPLAVAGAAYLLAIREFFCTPKFPKHVIVVGLLLAAVWQIAFLRIPTGSDDDVRRYVWDGRVQRLGYNPYLVVPNDPAVAALHTPETRTMNHAELSTLYPPGAELFFRLITAIHESTFAMRVAFVICDLAIGFVLLALFRDTGHASHWVLAYAWHPLLATAAAGSGHIDIVGALLLVVSFAALLHRRPTMAAVALALAVTVKFLPIVLLPLYWRRIRARDAVLAAMIFAATYLPFLDHGRIPTGSLGSYIQSFRFNDPVFTVVQNRTTPQAAVGFALIVGLLIALWCRRRSGMTTGDSFAWPMAASLLCAPVVYPWYLLWLLPFTRSVSTLPIILWTVSILPTYIVWHLRTLGNSWVLPGWVVLVEYGIVATTGGIILLRRFTQPKANRSAG